MSFCTFGLYDSYWLFRNWRYIKPREPERISPSWRTIFALFYMYPCLKRIKAMAVEKNIATDLPMGWLALGWICVPFFLVVLALMLKSSYGPPLLNLGALNAPLQCLFMVPWGYIFLLPVQKLVNQINLQEAPQHERNEYFTWLNICWIVVWLALVSFVIYYTLTDPIVSNPSSDFNDTSHLIFK